MSHKSWCFTINNYVQEDIVKLEELAADGTVTCMFVARERGEEGTPHLQGYVTFKASKRLLAAKAAINGRAHLEPSRGTRQDNRRYIIEGWNADGTKKVHSIPIINLERGSQGERTDLSAAIESARTGGLHAVAEHHPGTFVKYHRGLQAYVGQIARSGSGIDPGQRLQLSENVWLYGPTTVGKSFFARTVSEMKDIFYASLFPDWFDGFNHHDVVVIDELDKNSFKWGFFLSLCGRDPFTVAVKGGSMNFNPKHIIITSTDPPMQMCERETKHQGLWPQVQMRFNFGTRNNLEDEWEWDDPNAWPAILPPDQAGVGNSQDATQPVVIPETPIASQSESETDEDGFVVDSESEEEF